MENEIPFLSHDESSHEAEPLPRPQLSLVAVRFRALIGRLLPISNVISSLTKRGRGGSSTCLEPLPIVIHPVRITMRV